MNLKIVLLLLLGVFLVGGVMSLFVVQAAERERTAAMAAELERVLEEATESEPAQNEAVMFNSMLDVELGREWLAEMDAKSDRMVYLPERGWVFFLHSHGDERPSCIGSAGLGSNGKPHSGHSGVPDFLQLDGIDFEGDTLSVRCTLSDAEEDELVLRRMGLEPGSEITRLVDLHRLDEPYLRYDHLDFEKIVEAR